MHAYKLLLRELFYGSTLRSRHFNEGVLLVDLFAIGLLLVPLVVHDIFWLRHLEVILAFVYGLELTLRAWVNPRFKGFLTDWHTLIDAIIVASLLIPNLAGSLAFLRLLRALRVLRIYRAVSSTERLSQRSLRFHDLLLGLANILTFTFIMTSVVLLVEGNQNEGLENPLDALYFTMASLTTTGYGDITAVTGTGKLLAILIMFFGITLFLKLAQSVLRPQKAMYVCPDCGLRFHDTDAVHCKHCGHIIYIETNGLD